VSWVEGTAGLLSSFSYGRGFTERVAGTAPAAGQPFTFAMDGRYNTRPVAVLAQLVTAAGAANRWPELRALDADGTVWNRWGGAPFITASLTVQLVWQLGRGDDGFTIAGADSTPYYMPLTDVWLEGSDQLRIFVGNMQAGDALTAPRLVLERFETGPRGYPEGRVPERVPVAPR